MQNAPPIGAKFTPIHPRPNQILPHLQRTYFPPMQAPAPPIAAPPPSLTPTTRPPPAPPLPRLTGPPPVRPPLVGVAALGRHCSPRLSWPELHQTGSQILPCGMPMPQVSYCGVPWQSIVSSRFSSDPVELQRALRKLQQQLSLQACQLLRMTPWASRFPCVRIFQLFSFRIEYSLTSSFSWLAQVTQGPCLRAASRKSVTDPCQIKVSSSHLIRATKLRPHTHSNSSCFQVSRLQVGWMILEFQFSSV